MIDRIPNPDQDEGTLTINIVFSSTSVSQYHLYVRPDDKIGGDPGSMHSGRSKETLIIVTELLMKKINLLSKASN